MENADLVYSEDELDGVRVLRAVMPETIAPSMLAAIAARYLAFWDDERPTVGLGDVTNLRELGSEIADVMAVFIRRVTILPNYVGSAWFTGPNHALAERMRALAAAAGRDPNSIVETEADAIAYLRERIEAFRAAERPSEG